jgi:release factor glutamine methyltransferase
LAQCLALLTTWGLERLDAQLLLLHALGRPGTDRAWLAAHGSDALAPDATNALQSAATRRITGEPLAYITGHKEFFGLDLQVDARVLVPRPDTETLVEWALELLPAHAEVMDLGTGSGAIALALKHTRPDLHLTAVDLSQEALAVASANAQRLQLDVSFRQGHWLAGEKGLLDAIVANPPYIAEQDPHLAALAHEPTMALTSGEDGLVDIEAIIVQSASRLKAGGWVLLEHGYDQASAVQGLLTSAGFTRVQSRQDLAGLTRCTGGCWAGGDWSSHDTGVQTVE